MSFRAGRDYFKTAEVDCTHEDKKPVNPEIEISHFLLACCNGDEAAWAQFFTLFHPLIAGTVYKSIIQDHDDTIQTVYLKLVDDNYRLLKSFRGETFYEFLAYLRQVTLNTAANQRRHLRVNKERHMDVADIIDSLSTEETPETRFLQAEVSQEILDAIMALDVKYREVAYLALQGYKHREIAAILKLPIDTASTRIRRAHAKLKEILQEFQIP